MLIKGVFRVGLLAVAVFLYFVDRARLDFVAIFDQGLGGIFLWIVWSWLVVDMLFRIIPNKRIPIGARKHYACSYSAAPPPKNGKPRLTHKGAFLSAAAWAAITTAALIALFALNALNPAVVIIIVLAYSVADMFFISFFCPFQKLFMRNRCCAVCRIYNWDYFMMCAPLIVFPGAYSVSLFALSAAVVLRWEWALRKNPHFFMEATNQNLRCGRCETKCRRS